MNVLLYALLYFVKATTETKICQYFQFSDKDNANPYQLEQDMFCFEFYRRFLF